MTAPNYFNNDDDSPFQGLVPAAVERLRKRQAALQVPFGPDWLQPTGPYHWDWDREWQIYLYDHLNALARGEIEKLMLFAPVRHGKTEATTVRFPVYWLENWPDQRVIVGMHTQTLANKISRKARRIARDRLRMDPEREAVEDWGTIEGGGFRAIGVGAAIAGEGGNLFCIDDPIRSRMEAESITYREKVWDWWTDDLYTRREPHARMLVTMARWHEDDMAGRILNSADGKNWTVIKLPALAEEDDPLGRQLGEALDPDRWPAEELIRARDQVYGSYAFAGLYQQRPAPAEGGIFKRVWWQFWEPKDQILGPIYAKDADGKATARLPIKLPDSLDETAQSWDMSFKGNATSDHVAAHVWSRKGARAFLRSRLLKRMDFPATLFALRKLTQDWPEAERKWIEDTANGPAVIASLRGNVPGLIGVPVDGDKVARAHAVTWLVEAGNVFLPHPSMAPCKENGFQSCQWVWDFIEAFASFPNSDNDHDVDAGTQALRKLFPLGIVEDVDYIPARIHA